MPRSTATRTAQAASRPSAKGHHDNQDVAPPAPISRYQNKPRAHPGLAHKGVRRCAPPASSTPRDHGGRRGTARRSVPGQPAPDRSPRRAAQDADPGPQEETGRPGRPPLDGHATRPSPQTCSRTALAEPGSATTTPPATPPPDQYGHARLPWQPAVPARDLTPGRVRAQFRAARQTAGTPASPPKTPSPGPGRPKGSKNKHKAPRQPVGKRHPKRAKRTTKPTTG